MNQEPKAYSYVRFSTPEQAKGNSLERQTAASEKYAREHNLTLDKSLKADQGVSAFRRKNALRGNLANFLKEISDGQVPKGSVLIIENMDRLSRAPIMDSSEIVNQILRAGIDIVTLSDGLRHRAADIELNSYAYMLPVMSLCRAYEESKRKSELLLKTWESKRKAAMKGERLTSTCPGWLIPTEIGFEIIPERAVIVREIFDLTLQGWGAYRIAQKFSSEEVPPFSSGRKREAKGWHSSFITSRGCRAIWK